MHKTKHCRRLGAGLSVSWSEKSSATRKVAR